MANPRIEVEISSNIEKLKKAFSESEAAVVAYATKIAQLKAKFSESNGVIDNLKNRLGQLKTNLERATDIQSIAKYNIRIKQTEDELNRLSKAGLQAGNRLNSIGGNAAVGLNRLTRATSSYNSVAIEFSRIVQDAPFGIIGVANNITQLTQSLQNGRAAGQSYTQLLSGIFSGGNLLVLGISALTSAFVILQQKGFFKTTQDAKSLNEALKEYQENLEGVSAATLKGAQDAQKEIASIRGLRLQIENTNVSQKDRVAAVKELQNEYPSYFGNLSQEQILTGNVGEAYALVTKNLIAKAKAQASLNVIAENSIKLLTVETKLEEIRSKRLIETASAQSQIDALNRRRQEQGFLLPGEIQQYERLISQINRTNKSRSEEETLLTEKLNLLTTNRDLEGNINSLLSTGATLTEQKTSATKALKLAEDELIKAVEFENRLRGESLARVKELFSELESRKPKDITVPINFTPSEQGAVGLPGGMRSISDIQAQISSLERLRQVTTNPESFAKYNEQLRVLRAELSLLQSESTANVDVLVDSFSSLGIAIGNSLDISNNALKGFIITLLSNTPKIIQAISAQARAQEIASKKNIVSASKEATADAIVTGGKAAKALGPLGLALLPVFIGGAVALISNAFSKIGGGGSSAGGGGVSGVGSGTSFLGTSSDTFSANRNIALTGQFRIDGNDLVYVIDRSLERQD